MDKESKKIIEYKIKKINILSSILTDLKKSQKKVIMCHGTFDIVHPGHIRHLLYAKSKADILVVSLTSDEHIEKDMMRPFVPEGMRAFNLAALGIVDYVLIDKNDTPIENIKILQPDFYAKGYEYGSEKPKPKTQEEIEALNTYGGQIIFTPGDIVYSSSKIINLQKPAIFREKMLFLI